MKNIVAILLAVTTLICLTSCSTNRTSSSEQTTSSQDTSINIKVNTWNSPIWEKSKDYLLSDIEYKLSKQSIATGSYSFSQYKDIDDLYTVRKNGTDTHVSFGFLETDGGTSVIVFNSGSGQNNNSDDTLAFVLLSSIVLTQCNPERYYESLGEAQDEFIDIFEGFEDGFSYGDISKQVINNVEYSLGFAGSIVAFSASNPDGASPLDELIPSMKGDS